MKIRPQFVIVAAALALALAACGGSSDDRDRWSVTVSDAARALTSPGSATLTADGTGVSLVGGNASPAQADGSACSGARYGFADAPCRVLVMNNDNSVRGTVSFDWTYASRDTSGPGADLFGVLVDGKPIALSDPGGRLQQSGRRTVTVTTSLGWYLNCTDCTQGEAEARVSAISVR